MIPKVTVSLSNGNIGGATQTNDGVVGLVCTGTTNLGTSMVVYSLADAISKGITLAANPVAHRFVKEFYSVDGTANLPLYILMLANTATVTNTVDKDNASGAKKLLDFAAGKIRVLGVSRTPAVEYDPDPTAFFDPDVTGALANAKALAAAQFAAVNPVRVLLDCRVHDNAEVPAWVPNTKDANNVGFVVGGAESTGNASMGLVLGKIAASPVHRNIGRVKDGALPIAQAYIGNKKVEEFAGLNSLIDNGFITFTSYPQKAGYFISDDPMSTAATDDIKFLAHGRTIDKASIIAYQTFVEELKDDVQLQANGTLAPIVIKHLEANIENNINLSMAESISSVAAVIDPTQNLASGSKLKIKLRITPRGYLKEIEVDLGFGVQS
ncbi:DUF2586 family protein [Nubsella zeaxanthinifaciens]|uniref:DUF2586 family protein n=1 Tax=Nubsella zeaxanthinifaciens TaxID=392412 RepID=UPI000DE2690F|nr:DUF2586 family protein [Nubsella zeaxanthinifaciens]